MEINNLKEKYELFFHFLERDAIRYYIRGEKIHILGNLFFGKYLYESPEDFQEKNENEKNKEEIVFPDNVFFSNSVHLDNNYNYKFGKNTHISGDLISFNNTISLGGSLIVDGDVRLSGSIIKQFPCYFNIGKKLFLNNTSIVNENKSLGEKTIVGAGFDSSGSNITNFGKDFCLKRGPLNINGISIPDNLPDFCEIEIDYNYNYNKNLIRIPSYLKQKQNIELSCKGMLIENIHELKNTTNITLKLYRLKTGYVHINNAYKTDFLNNFDFKKLDYYDKVNIINLFSYMAPTSLHKKLFLNNINEINKEEIDYFIRNKERLEKKTEFDENNIIYYCRTKSAIEFLEKNNYHFNEKELENIKNTITKTLYEKMLMSNEYKIKETKKINKIKKIL